MKISACQLSLIFAAVLAAPAALAGQDVLKCVDRMGHITLTDQPCAPGSTTQRLVAPDTVGVTGLSGSYGSSGAAGSTSSGGDEPLPLPANAARPVEHYPAPAPLPPRSKWHPPAAKRTSLSRDEATLKAAHLQLLMKEGSRQGRLARLD